MKVAVAFRLLVPPSAGTSGEPNYVLTSLGSPSPRFGTGARIGRRRDASMMADFAGGWPDDAPPLFARELAARESFLVKDGCAAHARS